MDKVLSAQVLVPFLVFVVMVYAIVRSHVRIENQRLTIIKLKRDNQQMLRELERNDLQTQEAREEAKREVEKARQEVRDMKIVMGIFQKDKELHGPL